jgi:hypothetical protein
MKQPHVLTTNIVAAIWPFHWLTTMPGALPTAIISPTQFPKTFAWISRFDKHTKSAHKSLTPPPASIKGPDAAKRILSSDFTDVQLAAESCAGVELGENEPSGLKVGDEVKLSPTDSGASHKDVGKLVWLDGEEIVIEKKSEEGVPVRIHAPRHGFRVVRSDAGAKL